MNYRIGENILQNIIYIYYNQIECKHSQKQSLTRYFPTQLDIGVTRITINNKI